MAVTLEDYIRFLDDYCVFYQELADFQEKKLQVILANSVMELDKIVDKEQVYVLRARGLEEKRFKMQQQIGYGDKTFQEIIDDLQDTETKMAMDIIKNRLDALITIVERNNTLCAEMVDERLASLDGKIKALADKSKIKPSHLMNQSV